MVMVITIFTIISGVALFNFGDYSDSISLQNLAHQISLEIVQAQRDAISGRNAPQFDPDRPSYGVAFSSSPSCVQDFPCESKFIRFADIDNNGKYETTVDLGEEISITRGNIIEEVDPVDAFITFCRPYPDAYITTSSIFSSCLSSDRQLSSPKVIV